MFTQKDAGQGTEDKSYIRKDAVLIVGFFLWQVKSIYLSPN